MALSPRSPWMPRTSPPIPLPRSPPPARPLTPSSAAMHPTSSVPSSPPPSPPSSAASLVSTTPPLSPPSPLPTPPSGSTASPPTPTLLPPFSTSSLPRASSFHPSPPSIATTSSSTFSPSSISLNGFISPSKVINPPPSSPIHTLSSRTGSKKRRSRIRTSSSSMSSSAICSGSRIIPFVEEIVGIQIMPTLFGRVGGLGWRIGLHLCRSSQASVAGRGRRWNVACTSGFFMLTSELLCQSVVQALSSPIAVLVFITRSAFLQAELLVHTFVHFWKVNNNFSPLPVSVCHSFGLLFPWRAVLGATPPTAGLGDVLKLFMNYLNCSLSAPNAEGNDQLMYGESPVKKASADVVRSKAVMVPGDNSCGSWNAVTQRPLYRFMLRTFLFCPVGASFNNAA